MRLLTRVKKGVYSTALRCFGMLSSNVVLRLPAKLVSLPHCYAGHNGPWIENYFYFYWCCNRGSLKNNKIRRTYLPLFWTDYYQEHGFLDRHPEVQEFMDKNIDPHKKYFTIVQNDDGILEKVPRNVLVFSAGGRGDIPIPLIKRDLRRGERKRDIKCSFMGPLDGPHDKTGVRSKMYGVLKDRRGFYFGQGTMPEFVDVTARSVFTLCPRGYGKSSFRLYEAMGLGSIPVYIWDDVEWLPYRDTLDWGEFSISINIKDIEILPEIIDAHTPEMIRKKQEKIKQLYNEYFTLEGSCDQIIRMLRGNL